MIVGSPRRVILGSTLETRAPRFLSRIPRDVHPRARGGVLPRRATVCGPAQPRAAGSRAPASTPIHTSWSPE